MREPVFSYGTLEKQERPCPICTGRAFKELSKKDRYRMGIRTVGCQGCGLVFTNPQLTELELAEFYLTYYRHYYQDVRTPSVEYVERYGKDERARQTVDYLVSQSFFRDGMRVLDVGCAEGSLLREIGKRSQGGALVGVEPDEKFSAFARTYAACTTYERLDQVQASGKQAFDLIVVNHVLEHVGNPVAFLRRLSGLLLEGGTLYVDVPSVVDYESIEALHIAHLYHFSAATLRLTAEAAGFVTTEIERHEPPMHPISLRSVMRPAGDERGRVVQRTDDYRESWNRIRALDARAWRYFVRRSRIAWILWGGPKSIVRRFTRKANQRA